MDYSVPLVNESNATPHLASSISSGGQARSRTEAT